MARKFPTQPQEIGDEPIYLILKPRSTYIPGDERSRTNPGHGYPAGTEHSWDIEIYTYRAEWEAEIKRATASRTAFKAGLFTPAKVVTEVKVEVTVG